jgi:hypothetical protein
MITEGEMGGLSEYLETSVWRQKGEMFGPHSCSIDTICLRFKS